MFYTIGLCVLMIWLLGLLGPYTITSFMGILLITAVLNFLFKKIKLLKLIKIKVYTKLGFNQY